MKHYYNEIDPKAAAWLKELICSGYIPNGDVDTRSIAEINPDDLYQYIQCHFFAGIGGWPLALSLAGWPEDRPVWTGSCPCQPFSAVGNRLAEKDKQHLWPCFFRLISERLPPVVFGEQVASRPALGWIDGVFAALEAQAYACAAADLCAAGIGAPHIRQRLYWVGYTNCAGLEGYGESPPRPEKREAPIRPGIAAGAWSDFNIVHCADGKARRIESGTFPLAHGVSGRVGLLRGYGNAVVPQVAAAFVQAFLELKQPL